MSRSVVRPRARLARLRVVIPLLIMLVAVPTAVFAASPAIVREELNLRSGPGTGYAIVTVMPPGAAVTVTGEASEGFYPVTYGAQSGWAYAEYLAIGGAVNAATNSALRSTATVITSLLNLRSGPGTGYGVVAQLPFGTTLEITDDATRANGRSWLPVMSRGHGSGWVAAEYVEAGEQPPSKTPAAPPPAPAPEVVVTPPSSGNPIIDIITDAANRYGQSPSAMIAVARCESNLNPGAVNSRSGASGLFQFLPGTWRTTPFASSSILDAWANANAAAWMWSVGRRGEWVC